MALQQRLWELIRELNAGGVTIILTTHYLEEAQALCDRIAIINHGRLITEENTATLLKGMGSKSLVLTLTEEPQSLPAALADMQVQLEERRLQITYSPDSTNTAAILAAINAAGLAFTDVTTEEPNLEDVFLDLTASADGRTVAGNWLPLAG